MRGCKCPPYCISIDDVIGLHCFDHLKRVDHSHGWYPQEVHVAGQGEPGDWGCRITSWGDALRQERNGPLNDAGHGAIANGLEPIFTSHFPPAVGPFH